MKILKMILAIILCITLCIFIRIKANKKAKDIFSWGYCTGILVAFILDIALEIVK